MYDDYKKSFTSRNEKRDLKSNIIIRNLECEMLIN